MSWQFNNTDIDMPNMVTANTIPLALLQKGFIPMVRMWDKKWEPVLGAVMPETKGNSQGLSHFTWPVTVDPGVIADMHSPYGRATYITTGANAESWNTRLVKMGFAMEPEEFLPEFSVQGGFGTSVKMQHLTQICIRAIERRIELELVNYLYGNTTAIRQFSNQKTDRLKRFDLTSATDGMTGYTWTDHTNSNPFADIDNAIEWQMRMGSLDLTMLFIGAITAKTLKNHSVILERIKYVRDVSGGTLSAFFGGLQNNMMVKVVRGQSYKENSTNVNAVGGPGRGDLAAASWASFNKYWYMRAASHEFAFLTPSSVGFTFTSRCNQFHNGEGMYVYSHVDHEPHITRTRMEKKFAPGVADFGEYVVLQKTAPVT